MRSIKKRICKVTRKLKIYKTNSKNIDVEDLKDEKETTPLKINDIESQSV